MKPFLYTSLICIGITLAYCTPSRVTTITDPHTATSGSVTSIKSTNELPRRMVDTTYAKDSLMKRPFAQKGNPQ